MDKITLQQTLDIEKWLNSEKLRRDLCGEYDYCAYCENEKEYPCALAYMRMESKNKAKTQNITPVVDEVNLNINANIEENTFNKFYNGDYSASEINAEYINKNTLKENPATKSTADNDNHNLNHNDDNIAVKNGDENLKNSNVIGDTIDITNTDIAAIPNTIAEIAASLLNINKSITTRRKVKTFAEKFANLKPEIKSSFVTIENAFEEYGIKSKMTKKYVNFRLKRNLVGIVSINRGSLRLQLALLPDDYRDSKIPFDDYSNKKCYSKAPFSIKIKSPLSVRRACKLIGDAVKKIKENL